MKGVTQSLGNYSAKIATRRAGGTSMHLLGSKSEKLHHEGWAVQLMGTGRDRKQGRLSDKCLSQN